MAFGRLPNPRPPRNPVSEELKRQSAAAQEAQVATQLYPRHPDDELNLLANLIENARRQLISAAAIADRRGASETHNRLLNMLSIADDTRAAMVEEGEDG